MSSLVVFPDAVGQWRWHLKAANGEIVAQSEAYTRKLDAVRGANALVRAVAELNGQVTYSTWRPFEPAE